MYIFRVKLQEFQKKCDFQISNLNKYHVKEEYSIDSVSLESISEVKIEQQSYINRYQFKLSNSEILNFILHRTLWKSFLKKNVPWCMIVESNINGNVDFEDIINTINIVPEDWDIFFPYDARTFHNIHKIKKGMSLLNPNIRENKSIEPYLLGFKWGNFCYFISKQGAKKLLKMNVINDRLDDSLLALSITGDINIYVETVDWFDFSNIVQWEYQERRKLIWNAILQNSPWTTLRKERVRSLLKVINEIAVKLNVDIVLQGGTHLGYIRHGEIMSWDDDVDLGIEEKHTKLFFETLKDYGKGLRFGCFIEPLTNCPYYKIWHEDGEVIDKYDYTFPFVDLWVYNIKNYDLVFKNGIICKNSAQKDLITVSFENANFKIPFNSIDVLDTRYTDWKTKIRVYSYSHRLEKRAFPPLIFPIEVNDKGRLVMEY